MERIQQIKWDWAFPGLFFALSCLASCINYSITHNVCKCCHQFSMILINASSTWAEQTLSHELESRAAGHLISNHTTLHGSNKCNMTSTSPRHTGAIMAGLGRPGLLGLFLVALGALQSASGFILPQHARSPARATARTPATTRLVMSSSAYMAGSIAVTAQSEGTRVCPLYARFY